MKNNVFVKTWNVIYPIFIYFVVSNVVMYLAMLSLQISGKDYMVYYMMLQTIAAAISLPILYRYYRRDQLLFTVFHQRTANEYQELTGKRKVLNGVLTFACGALAGVVLNNLIGATGLTEVSNGYQAVTQHFWAGGIFFEILGAGILVPLVEELLYRGIVYARLSDWVGLRAAAVVSALIFGALHLNLVQFIYASLTGLLLVLFLEKTHNLYGAVLGHIGANLLTVLRVETRIFDWMADSNAAYWISTIAMGAVCVALLGVLIAGDKGEKENK